MFNFRKLFGGTPVSELSDDDKIAAGKENTAGNKTISWANFKALLGTLFVSLTGNQIISGIKTFNGRVIVPEPVNQNDAATRAFVEANAGGGGGSGVLERDVTVTRTGSGYAVGTVLAAGTPLTDVIEGDLSPYVTNAITGLTISFSGFSGTAEVGRELTVTQAAYTSSLDSAGNPVQNIKIAGIGFDADTVRTASPVAADLAPFIATRSTAGTISWTATGEDAKGAAKSRTATQTFQYMHGFGASATVVSDNATAQAVYNALQQKALMAGRGRILKKALHPPINYTHC